VVAREGGGSHARVVLPFELAREEPNRRA
jgi:hypothetical protein